MLFVPLDFWHFLSFNRYVLSLPDVTILPFALKYMAPR